MLCGDLSPKRARFMGLGSVALVHGPYGGWGSCPTWPTGAADFFSVAGNEAPREETCTGSFSQPSLTGPAAVQGP